MTAMSQPAENESRKVIRLEIRRVERRVPGVGTALFRAPSIRDEMRLAEFHTAEVPDHRAFVNQMIAATLASPEVAAADVDAWTERARAIARVAVAEATGCIRYYRRLAGSGLSGDEKLYRAMRTCHERQIEQLRRATASMSENVVRMVEQTGKALLQSGVFEYLERNQRQMQRMAQIYTRSFRPAPIEQIRRISRQFEQVIGPSLLDQFAHRASAMNSFVRGYARMAEHLSRRLDLVARPSYFGALEQMSRQINEVVRPRYLDSVSRLIAQMQEAALPSYLNQVATFGRWLQELRRPLVETLRDFLESYAAWLERNWAEVYADPDYPPPFMFVLASLPMAIGLPLLRALETDDEPLLVLLEGVIDQTLLLDAVHTAVEQNAELDAIAKRYLVRALDHLRTRQYVDAEPPLYQGLERAFRLVARQRGIVDAQNKFMVKARTAKARSVEDLFEHLALERRYLRFLRAWVFGDWGNRARHGDLAETEHRRWALRAFLAIVGWLEYCGTDEAPMAALVAQLELEAHGRADGVAQGGRRRDTLHAMTGNARPLHVASRFLLSSDLRRRAQIASRAARGRWKAQAGWSRVMPWR